MTDFQSCIGVRDATARDASVLAELAERTFRSAFSTSNSPEDIELYVRNAFAIRTVRRELAELRNTFLLALGPEGAIGYAKLREGPAPVHLDSERQLELHRLYVDARETGRGIGAALMRVCLHRAEALAVDMLWLGVWERNERAIAFYRNWGFEPAGAHVFQLGNDSQADIIMSRPVCGQILRGPDVTVAKSLLGEGQLPTTDIDAEKLKTFFYCQSGGEISGIVGVEILGSQALLRSLVVRDEWRAKGLGARLVAHAEAFAKASRVTRMYLLTTAAAAYFRRRGYVGSPRELAPEAIRRTSQFSELCPSSSILMLKHLES